LRSSVLTVIRATINLTDCPVRTRLVLVPASGVTQLLQLELTSTSGNLEAITCEASQFTVINGVFPTGQAWSVRHSSLTCADPRPVAAVCRESSDSCFAASCAHDFAVVLCLVAVAESRSLVVGVSVCSPGVVAVGLLPVFLPFPPTPSWFAAVVFVASECPSSPAVIAIALSSVC
jgi:hypothetical protein